MTEKHKSQTEDPEVAIQSAIGRVEGFIMNNGRSLLTALIVVVVVVGGFFGYKYLISGPRAESSSSPSTRSRWRSTATATSPGSSR